MFDEKINTIQNLPTAGKEIVQNIIPFKTIETTVVMLEKHQRDIP